MACSRSISRCRTAKSLAALSPALLSLLLLLPTANADEATTKGGLEISSEDGNFSASLGGRIHFDTYAFETDIEEPVSTSEFRRARITLKGNVYQWSYVLEQDFAAGNTLSGYRDVYIAREFYNGSLRIGLFKPFRSMTEMTSSNELTMLERPFSSSNGLYTAHQFQQGIGWLGNWDCFTLGLAAFNLRDPADPRNEGLGASTRFTWAPINDDYRTVHLGLSLSNQNNNLDSTDLTAEADYAGRRGPSQLMALTWGDEGGSADTAAIELAGTYGPLYVQAEYSYGDFDGDYYLDELEFYDEFGNFAPFPCDPILGCYIGDQDVRTWYIMGSWMLTGEHKPYNGKKGVFKSAKPPTGRGAWELTARYEIMENKDIRNLQATSTILGINYYANPKVRFMLNLTLGDNDFTGDGTNQLGFRAQMRW